jgi:hypothetical protein
VGRCTHIDEVNLFLQGGVCRSSLGVSRANVTPLHLLRCPQQREVFVSDLSLCQVVAYGEYHYFILSSYTIDLDLLHFP